MVAGLVSVLVVAGAGAALVGPEPPRATSDAEWSTPGAGNGTATGVSYFDGEAEFREYVQASQRLGSGGAPVARASGAAGGGDGGGGDAVAEQDATVETTGGTATAADTGSGADTRVGTTNVQVAGVDEPDLVKTDGEHFFYAPRERYRVVRTTAASGDGVAGPEPREQPDTTVIHIDEPAAPEVAAEINESGQLLQTGDSLVVLAPDELVGYDVSDADEPERVWSHPLNGSLVTARLVDGRLYVVTASGVDPAGPCPVEPLGGAAPVACTDIAHPETQVRADATYTVAAIDPATGTAPDATGLVGTRANTVVYADGEDLYLTYTERTDRTAVLTDYLVTADALPAGVKADVRRIEASDRPRREQLRAVNDRVQEWAARSDREEREVYSELTDGLQEYLGERKRTLTRTGVVRVELGERLEVAAHGSVPGEPLNQFSLSSHDGTLRVATTVPGYGGGGSENDLYTLDRGTLDRQGSVTGMGEGQRVYAVRYVGETAYVVTFRQVDPLHVVDLSDPADPVERGALELPGFSTYLHPVDKDHVVGVGEEEGRVKAVLFDVSDPTDPVVDDSLRLEAGWSAVADSHHAFTIDRRHEVFVLPAGRQALAVDYTDSSLDVQRRVETAEPVTRARYVGDYLYVFAGQTVTVLDELGWDVVEKLPG